MHIEILFEDNLCIIVNKPNNVLIHNSYYARNIKDETLLDLLKKQTNTTFYPVHRLDRKTSGVILLVKEKEFVSNFQTLFTEGLVKKTYLAIVRGFLTDSKEIASPVKHPETKTYKDATTLCTPINQKELNIPVHPYQMSRYSLVQLLPLTGRMHQLRIHMNKISHPIVGDYKYGDRFHNRMFENEFNCSNLFLHAFSLKFKHPKTNELIECKAKLPNDWEFILDKFEWNKKPFSNF